MTTTTITWIPATTLPPDDRDVLFTDGQRLWIGCWFEETVWIADYSRERIDSRNFTITHWAHLPQLELPR